MAMTYLTKLKPEPMGAHSLSTAYGVNSLVMSGDGAAAYISVKDVPAGTPLTNTEYWKKHTDLTAVKQSAEAAAQKANAARNEMLEIARSLTDMVEKSGNPVQAELVGGLPFDRVETMLEFIQSGSGDPSPSNIRLISGWTGATMTRCGKNLIGGFAGKTQNGLTFTINADGSVGVNGTSTAQTELSAPIYLPVGNYYLSGCPAGGTSSNVSGGYAQYCYINGSAYKFDTGSGIHLNIAYAQKIYLNIVIRANTTINKTFYPQIETGYRSHLIRLDGAPQTCHTAVDVIQLVSNLFTFLQNHRKTLMGAVEGWVLPVRRFQLQLDQFSQFRFCCVHASFLLYSLLQRLDQRALTCVLVL